MVEWKVSVKIWPTTGWEATDLRELDVGYKEKKETSSDCPVSRFNQEPFKRVHEPDIHQVSFLNSVFKILCSSNLWVSFKTFLLTNSRKRSHRILITTTFNRPRETSLYKCYQDSYFTGWWMEKSSLRVTFMLISFNDKNSYFQINVKVLCKVLRPSAFQEMLFVASPLGWFSTQVASMCSHSSVNCRKEFSF